MPLIQKCLKMQTKVSATHIGDIGSLLEIFASKEAFAKEYHLILSEQLISLQNYDADDQVLFSNQIRHVEILSERFGATDMQQAKVMMKDLADSRRIANVFYAKPSPNVTEAHVGELQLLGDF